MVIVRPGAAYPLERIPLRFIRVWVLVAVAPRTFGACGRLVGTFAGLRELDKIGFQVGRALCS